MSEQGEELKGRKKARSSISGASTSAPDALLPVEFKFESFVLSCPSASALAVQRGWGEQRRQREQRKASTSIRWQNAVEQITFVLHPPLQLDDDHLSRELVQERLRIDGHGGLGDFVGFGES